MTQDPFYQTDSSGYGSYPQDDTPKKKRTWLIVIIVVAVLLLCCCAVLLAGWFLGDPILDYLRDMGIDLYLPLLVSA